MGRICRPFDRSRRCARADRPTFPVPGADSPSLAVTIGRGWRSRARPEQPFEHPDEEVRGSTARSQIGKHSLNTSSRTPQRPGRQSLQEAQATACTPRDPHKLAVPCGSVGIDPDLTVRLTLGSEPHPCARPPFPRPPQPFARARRSKPGTQSKSPTTSSEGVTSGPQHLIHLLRLRGLWQLLLRWRLPQPSLSEDPPHCRRMPLSSLVQVPRNLFETASQIAPGQY
jgi:hypothetical protein